MQRDDVLPPGESKWEKFLLEIQIEEECVMNVLRQRDTKTVALYLWIRQNAQTAFVPEKVLEAVGINSRFLV